MKYDSIPPDQLETWSRLNNVQLHGVEIRSNILDVDGNSKGGGLVSTSDHASEDILLQIPNELVLCKDSILQCARSDTHLRQLLDVLDDFVQNPRKIIVLFLLYQMTISSPDFEALPFGVRTPFTDYFRALPKSIALPTFYRQEQRDMLTGTSLSEALEQKLSSLEREFEYIREKTAAIDWCWRLWWDEDNGKLTMKDWKLSDALYRSRALELPRGIGDAMVPVLDMANHAADNRYNARFDVDPDNGNVQLLVREGKNIGKEEEIHITYGCGGASEMIFSYGFLEEHVQSAREMFLSLQAPEDDPLRIAKMRFAKEAPGVRIFLDARGDAQFDSEFVWWICVNEEDGLDFEVLQTNDGARELQALWKGNALDTVDLKDVLMKDERKDIFLLRAVVTVQSRVEQQGEELSVCQTIFDEALVQVPLGNARHTYNTIRNLRELELNLLISVFGALENKKQGLLQNSRILAEFLADSAGGVAAPSLDAEGHQEDDFS